MSGWDHIEFGEHSILEALTRAGIQIPVQPAVAMQASPDNMRVFREALLGDEDAMATAIRILVRQDIVSAPEWEAKQERYVATVLRDVRAGFNVSAEGPNPALSNPLGNYWGIQAEDIDIYLNGMLLHSPNHGTLWRSRTIDWYPGEDPGIGDLRFPFLLRAERPDLETVISMTLWRPVESFLREDALFNMNCIKAMQRILRGGGDG